MATKGIFQIKSMVDSVYSTTVHESDFKDQVIIVTIADVELTELIV